MRVQATPCAVLCIWYGCENVDVNVDVNAKGSGDGCENACASDDGEDEGINVL